MAKSNGGISEAAAGIKRPGAFSAKAKKAGMSTSAYATKVLKDDSQADTRTKRQAALAKTFAKHRPTHGSGKLTAMGSKTLGALQDKHGADEGRKKFHAAIKSGKIDGKKMFTEAQDEAADKKAGIKEGSAADKKLDKKRGLKAD